MDHKLLKSKLSLLLLMLLLISATTGCVDRFFGGGQVSHRPEFYHELTHEITEVPESFEGGHANLGHDPSAIMGYELNMVSLPPYVLEAPDVLHIQGIQLVPKSPYSLQPMDILQVVADNALPDAPLAGLFRINTAGRLDLGPAYGSIKVVGLNIDEAASAVEKHLRAILAQPQISISLAQTAGEQQIVGEHLLSLDGTVNLGTYGNVYIAGKTIPQARAAIEAHLSKFMSEPKISVKVFEYKSKAYYLVVEGAGNGDQIQKGIITGNETVLTVIANAGGLSQISSKRIWIARPGPKGANCAQILPVNWNEITRGGSTATNYQILPDDRIFVAEDRMVATTVLLNKLINPFERVFGFALLGGQTIQTFQRFPEGGTF